MGSVILRLGTYIPIIFFSVERYCPRTNTWTAAEPMHEARFGCAVVAHQGRIYVGGGFGQDKAILCTVESYDPDTDKVMITMLMSPIMCFLCSGRSCRT